MTNPVTPKNTAKLNVHETSRQTQRTCFISTNLLNSWNRIGEAVFLPRSSCIFFRSAQGQASGDYRCFASCLSVFFFHFFLCHFQRCFASCVYKKKMEKKKTAPPLRSTAKKMRRSLGRHSPRPQPPQPLSAVRFAHLFMGGWLRLLLGAPLGRLPAPPHLAHESAVSCS